MEEITFLRSIKGSIRLKELKTCIFCRKPRTNTWSVMVFTQSLKENAERVSKIGHDKLFSHPYQFIIYNHPAILYHTTCVVDMHSLTQQSIVANKTLQATFVILAFDILVFAYPLFYINIITRINMLSEHITCIETSPGLTGNVMKMISLASKNSGASLTSKWRLLFASCFTRFRYTWRPTGMKNPCITGVTCILCRIP
jgi:hypothetical protein